jgi:uncharacterized protein
VILDPLVVAGLAGAAFAAGFVDAIAGGGGILTVPALLAAGLDPHVVLGTNKGQSVFGAAASVTTFFRKAALDKERIRWTFPAGFFGSLAGAALVLQVRPEPLRPIVLGLLVAAAVLLVVLGRKRRRLEGRVAGAQPVHAPGVWLALSLGIGAYDGFFGPGTGSFLIVGFMALSGDDALRASGNAKIVNFASNLAAVLLFSLRGIPIWEIAMPMALANVLGATLGARLAIKKGAGLVRGLTIAVVLVLIGKILRDMIVG